MPIYTDQLNRRIALDSPPERIISLVPSQTELLYTLGVAPVAQTVFCIHPEKAFKTAQKIGGTKKLQLQKIKQLQPDLIIGNMEENDKRQIEELAREFPVWMSDIRSFEQALEMITSVGELIGRSEKANELRHAIQRAYSKDSSLALKVIYLIWKDPYMAVGSDSFINAMIAKAGFENVLADRARYPVLSLEDIASSGADLILLSSEPFPFKDKHKNEFKNSGIPAVLVDGEMFSWYGDRMLRAQNYFEGLKAEIASI